MISGFTIVRNAEKLDYPFEESIASLFQICDEVIINCGDSEDNTEAICERLKTQYGDRLQVFYTQWTRENQKGGFQLKAQTDAALARCRGEWCFYLQADEVIHEEDIDNIKIALKKAEQTPEVDGVLFDYLHFYGNYDYTMSGRNWYRKEVRLFKNHRPIEAFRDAQGFRKNGQRLMAVPSGARVFHYGYVRNHESMKKKAGEMGLWWGNKTDTKEDLTPKKHIGLRKFHLTHPMVMEARLLQNKHCFDPSKGKRKWDRNELKNAITFLWESIVPYRIGEFRNYEIYR